MTFAVPDSKIQVDPLVHGRWRLDHLIGQGGMSDVYRAVDEQSGEAVAVKLVRSADPGLARRLAQEAKALEGFDHPGLVRLLASGVHAQRAYLVMELVEGPTLAARLRRGPLGPARTAGLGSVLADALAYVHERGIVHRDLKPANVLLGPGPRVRLADFGIARLLDASSFTVTGSTLGTAAYMAPEQIEEHSVGTEADVWSLGLVLLESLTGKRTFSGTPSEVVTRRLAGPVTLPGDLPAPWRLLLEAMLDHDVGRRPGAGEVAGMLSAPAFSAAWRPTTGAPTEPLDAGGPQDAEPPDSQRTVVDKPDPTLVAPTALRRDPAGNRRGARRRRYVIAALSAILALVGGLTAWEVTSSNVAAHTPPRHGSASTTTSSTTTTSTSTTLPSVGDTAATLLRDVQAGVAAGSIDQVTGNSILQALNQVLEASDSENSSKTSSALGNLEASIGNGASSGKITPAEASTLSADVAALAGALGVSTTTTISGPASGPGGANPPGHGAGKDGGNG